METVFGVETEYAVTLLDGRGNRINPQMAADRLMELAERRYPCLPSSEGHGIFLANGARFYIDVGCHPEYATPECPTPWDLVRYTLAGDHIMGQLAEDFRQSRRSCSALVFRGNTGYGSQPESWACHESYLCHRPPAAFSPSILPFLASRPILAGSGGFDPFSPGIAFTLSPRSHFLTTVTSLETMHSRPLLNLRDEPLAGSGYQRLHLICADALGSEAAAWLRAGTTALVIALIDAGSLPVPELMLQDPLAALRIFAADPTLKATVPTVQGREISALDIQKGYLARVGDSLKRGALPEWADQVVESWDRMLGAAERQPQKLDTVLDWAIKRAVYADCCASRGVPWSSLPHWTHLVTRLDSARGGFRPGMAPLTLEKTREPGPVQQEALRLSGYLQEKGLDWDQFPAFMALRDALMELDTRFLQIGGIFGSLDREGALNHRVLTEPGAIEAAVLNPPGTGRAAVRGRFVREMARSGRHLCSWTRLINVESKQSITLSDPLQGSVDWSRLSPAGQN